MLSFVRLRVFWLLVTLLGVSIVTFALIHLIPGGPFTELAGTGGRALSPEVVAQIERFYGLDKPLWQQYLVYIANVLRGDFGRSLVDLASVEELIGQGLPVSAVLGLSATIVAVVVGIPLGVLAAVRKDSWIDQFSTGASVLGVTVPSFVLAFLLIIIFALQLAWLPVAGWGTWKHWLLPVVTLSMEPIALFTRYTRASMLEALGEVYVTVARSKGLAQRAVFFKHALKNALFPVITVFGLIMPHLIVGSFLIETVFAIPGSGRFFVVSISRRDYPVVMGMAILYASLVTLVNLLVDLTYRYLDPRIRYD